MEHGDAGKARGFLKVTREGVSHSRRLPSEDIGFFVESFWLVQWDLRGRPSERQETLPHPSLHIVFENGTARLFGVTEGKFTTVLEGKGQTFGIKFKPGGYYPFVQRPVSEWTNRIVVLEDWALSGDSEEEMIECAEAAIRARIPPRDKITPRVAEMVYSIQRDHGILTVDKVCERFGLGRRALQRLFSERVGVSPKWVIRRYRLHEALERMTQGDAVNWASLAADLGYFDQAHFIRDFKSIVGQTPGEFVKGS